jgi:Flp pilus assembly pilin Flp
MKAFLAQLWCNNRGATAIEYGLMVALFSVACIAAFQNFASGERSVWNFVNNEAGQAMNN